MTYSQQSFSVGSILYSSELEQIEANIRDHVHGDGNVSHHVAASFYSDTEQVCGSYQVVIEGLSNARYNNGYTINSSNQIFTSHEGYHKVIVKLACTSPLSGANPSIDIWKPGQGSPEITAQTAVVNSELNDIIGSGFIYMDGTDQDYMEARFRLTVNSVVLNHSIINTFINITKA